ncbi:MAG: 4-hydroxythreonine-4-phosphate dehydrogenase PdxA [Armatimonadetes bacterium]|nr:4-hydroxythreonine-4-phosphate dehydrogenase PdxA [Armatimonadota bacterium]
MKSDRPLLAITLGDPAGVGPEVVLKALRDASLQESFVPVVIGSLSVLEKARQTFRTDMPLVSIPIPGAARERQDVVPVLDLMNLRFEEVTIGRVSAQCGRAAVEYVEKAARLALAGEVDAVVTAPLNKEAIRLSGCPYPGHTEILAQLTGSPRVSMMLLAGPLRVAHVTTHLSLRDAIAKITRDRILETLRTAHDGLRRLGIARPHIAVAGLNPHAGEEGLFGAEEIEIIAPAVAATAQEGIHATGPYPPDTVFYRASRGEFDGVVAMYHDQGHIAVKMYGFDCGVNMTLGLPIIRTSVDHGTAFDIAWQGKASPESLKEAARIAAQMAAAKK